MRRQDYKRNERLYQVALRSDWTYSVKIALIAFVVGVWLIPALMAGNPGLHALARSIAFLGWVVTVGFGGLAVFRFVQQRRQGNSRED